MTNLEAAQKSYQEELVIDPNNASVQYQLGSLEAERHEVGERLLEAITAIGSKADRCILLHRVGRTSH